MLSARHLNITLNWYCGDSEMWRKNTQTHLQSPQISIDPSPQPRLGRTGGCSVWHECFLKTFQCSGQAFSGPTAQGNGHGCVRSESLKAFGPGPVLLPVCSRCAQSTGNSVSRAVPGRVCVCVSFRSRRDTQLSQLRLVGISPTSSQLSESSQYRSIVSWYLCVCVRGWKGCQNAWKAQFKFLISFLHISKIRVQFKFLRQYLMFNVSYAHKRAHMSAISKCKTKSSITFFFFKWNYIHFLKWRRLWHK